MSLIINPNLFYIEKFSSIEADIDNLIKYS